MLSHSVMKKITKDSHWLLYMSSLGKSFPWALGSLKTDMKVSIAAALTLVKILCPVQVALSRLVHLLKKKEV